jgi:hypothetical protein
VSNIRTIKIKKRTLAIAAAPDAISVNPKIAATIAITKNIAAHLNIVIGYWFLIDITNTRPNQKCSREYIKLIFYLFYQVRKGTEMGKFIPDHLIS